MINYLRVPKFNSGGSSHLGKVSITDEGRTMGALNWAFLIDPDHYVAEGSLVNRAKGGDTSEVVSAPVVGQFPNGKPAFEMTDADPGRFSGSVEINPIEHTIFFVFMPLEHSDNQRFITISGSYDSSLVPAFGIGRDADRLLIYENQFAAGSPLRLSSGEIPGLLDRQTPTLAMMTFSTERGLAIYENGRLAAADPSDTRPLEAGFGPGDWAIGRFSRGRFGWVGVLNEDLSRSAIRRRRVEVAVARHYGITGLL